MKLDKAMEGFFLFRAVDLSENTIKIYRWGLELLAEFLGNPNVEGISFEDLTKFMYYLEHEHKPKRMNKDTSPLAPASIENAWTAIRSFFNWAEEELKLEERPDDRLRRPKYGVPEIIPFTDDEVVELLKACEYTKEGHREGQRAFAMRRPTAARDQAIIYMLLDTGVRVSELCRLNVKDLNLNTGEISIKPFSTGSKTHSRTVVVGRKTKKALWRYLNTRGDTFPDEPLFLTVRDMRMNRNTVRVLLRDIGLRTGIVNVYPHKFRHTFAVFFLKNGGDVFTLQRILGHRSLEMVKRYLSLSTSDIINIHRNASPVDRLKQ